MQVDLGVVVSVVVSAFGAIVGTGGALYAGLLRYTIASKETEFLRQVSEARTAALTADAQRAAQLEELKRSVASLEAEREQRLRTIESSLHEQEIKLTKHEGIQSVLDQTNQNIKADVEEIKEAMVMRTEWDQRTRTLESQLEQVLRELRSRQTPGRYGLAGESAAPPRLGSEGAIKKT